MNNYETLMSHLRTTVQENILWCWHKDKFNPVP